MIGQIAAVIGQTALVLLFSPLITGFSKTLKARLQTRRGPGILQPYRDLHKLLRKGMVVPQTASWIFSATPYVLFATTLLAGLLIFAVLYAFAVWATKRDPQMLGILLVSARYRRRYDPLKHTPFAVEVRA